MASTQRIVFVVGPTASGKSELALKLALKFDGEIVCADSQTIRRDLDIGTAKPSNKDQGLVKHHLLGIINPYESFSVAQFKKLAEEAICDIKRRGKLPIIAGGTGLYVDALFYNYNLVNHHNIERTKLEQKTVKQLQKIIFENHYPMPKNSQNPRHLVGIILRRGQNPQDVQPIENSYIYGILPPNKIIKERIGVRVEHMFEYGLVKEVENIIEKYDKPTQDMDAIGYLIVQRHIDGEITLDDAKDLFKKAHWQYARRQKSWFKRNQYIQWSIDIEHAIQLVEKDLNNN